MQDIQVCYAILGVEPNASAEEVKHARKTCARYLHPDKYTYDPVLQKEVEERLKQVNAAYDAIMKHMKQGGANRSSRTADADASSRRARPAREEARQRQERRQEYREARREEHQRTRSSSADEEGANTSEGRQSRQGAAHRAYEGVKRFSSRLVRVVVYVLRTLVLGILLGVPTAQLAAEAYYKGMPSLQRATRIYTNYYGYLKDSVARKKAVGDTYLVSKNGTVTKVKTAAGKEERLPQAR